MKKLYADIIVDIVHMALDRCFQYEVPEEIAADAAVGSRVRIPFGKADTLRDGYIIGLTETPEYDPEKIKKIESVCGDAVPIESQLIRLAAWMKETYGSTMIQALKTVLPARRNVKTVRKRYLVRTAEREQCGALLEELRRKKQKARVRLLEAFLEDEVLPYEMVVHKLMVSPASFAPLEEMGIFRIQTEESYRNPIRGLKQETSSIVLNG